MRVDLGSSMVRVILLIPPSRILLPTRLFGRIPIISPLLSITSRSIIMPSILADEVVRRDGRDRRRLASTLRWEPARVFLARGGRSGRFGLDQGRTGGPVLPRCASGGTLSCFLSSRCNEIV